MHIPNRACVLVTDGRKRLMFRNIGDAAYPQLREIDKAEDDNPPDHVQKNDAPGHTVSSGGWRTAYVETDFHKEGEARFARETAAMLNRQAEDDAFDKLIVVADKRTLGELRDHYGPALEQRLIGEVAKDLVKHPVVEIERILSES